MKRFLWGLKLFSTNIQWLEDARKALDEGYTYIELYTVPGSLHTLPAWKALSCPFIIHAPHSSHGVNLSDPALRASNREIITEARHFADTLDAPHIIVHGGMPPKNVDGLSEVITQICAMDEPRLVLENTPMLGLEGGGTSAYSPQHLQSALQKAVTGCVLDLGHAVCAANSLQCQPLELIRSFIALRPALFHIADGVLASEKDVHRNIHHGDFPLAAFLALVPEDSRLTIETPKQNVAQAVDDMLALNALAHNL